MKPSRPCAAVGEWRIVGSDLWDRDFLDMLDPASLTIGSAGDGTIAFGALQAGLRVSYGATIVFFTWEGFDDMTQVRGHGSAELDEHGTLEIEFSYEDGDEAVFKAQRTTSSAAC